MKAMDVVGLMSGTSLDGVDLAACRFEVVNGTLQHRLLAACTVPYPAPWVRRLATLTQASALEYAKADVELGHFYGLIISDFINKNNLHIDAIASHGHTIFHQPQIGLTTQIGDADAIAAETGLLVVNRFRNLDVALGGQGAPLVPIGDKLLYYNYQGRLNLGGIANISYGDVAFDICPCNMALNMLAARLGQPYDKNGHTARSGQLHPTLLQSMNALPYYGQPAPKSLGKEWFEAEFAPLLNGPQSTANMLHTTTEHIAMQIANILNTNHLRNTLVTGGGARNTYLIERISALAPECRIVVPDSQTVDYKEAIVFALMGYLRLNNLTNCMPSVTGAKVESCGGNISGVLKTSNLDRLGSV